ncbi:MAG: HEAT repeat domain-containing protein, partial [Thermoplasmata archaeon]
MDKNGNPPEVSVKELAHHEDYNKRLEASQHLSTIAKMDGEDFALLKRLIKDGHEEVWKAASKALGGMASADIASYRYMLGLISDEILWVQMRGIWALGEYVRHEPESMAKLGNLAIRGRKEIREQAVMVLGLLAGENEEAFSIFGRLIESEDEKLMEAVLSSTGLLAQKRKGVLKQLEPFLQSTNNFFRLWASKALGEAACVNDDAYAIYQSLGDSEDVYIRRGFSSALSGVIQTRSSGAKNLVEKSINDSDRYVRANAAKALVSTLTRDSFPRLIQLLNSEKSDVRRGAAEGMLSMAERMPEELLQVIQKLVEDDDYHLRSQAAFASAKIAPKNPQQAIDILKKLSADKDEYVRRDAALAIRELPGNEAASMFSELKLLLEDRESIVRREAAKSLVVMGRLKGEGVLELTSTLIEDMDEGVRENAAEVIGLAAQKDPNRAFEGLKTLSLDESTKVRRSTAKGLEMIFDREPDLVIPRIWTLHKVDVSPEILTLLGKFARSDEIGQVCTVYGELKGKLNDSNADSCVTAAQRNLKDVTSLKYASEIEDNFRAFSLGLRARNINDMALIKFDYSPFKGLSDTTPPIDMDFLVPLEELPEMAVRYKQIEGLSDKQIYLGKMVAKVDSALEKQKEAMLPESMITKQILALWRGILSNTIDSLKGSANIKVLLRTRNLLPLDSVTLLLGLENTGESMAEHVRIELSPSTSYKIIDREKTIDMLARDGKAVAEFRIKPIESKDFRVKFNISYDDREMKGKSMFFADRVGFIEVPRKFNYIPNPYITGGPIKPSSKDMFFGRHDVFEFIKNNISSTTQKNVLIIQGERRTGKTSILYRAPEVLGDEYVCVFLDGQEFGRASLDYLFYRMAKLTAQACNEKGIKVPLPPRRVFKEDPWYEFKDQFLEKLSKALGDRYLVYLVDEFESLEYAVSNGTMDAVIFDYIRNLMQHEERLVFIFAGVHRLEEMMRDYWGVLFNIALYWKISFLEESAARQLIVKPVEGCNMMYDDLAQEKIIRATACHPYFVQLLCRFMINRHNSLKKNYITVQDVNLELDNVVEKAKPHFNYIWTLSSQSERLLLALLPEILRKKKCATHVDILKECEKLKINVPESMISSALGDLTARDILEKVTGGPVH